MPAYKHVLNEADLADLMSWLHDEKCCWNSDAPPLNPRYKGANAPARAALYGALTGGPKGLVKNARGEPIEGIMVQLISDETAIRTTVYSRADGRYEFPKVVPGSYTLRIAKPKEFYPFSETKVEIKGAETIDDITLLRVTPGEFLPPFPEIAAQLSGSEWLQNLPGTGEEKKTLTVYCNFCHEYQQIFRNRYDESGWAKIIFRMTHGAGSPLINIRNPGRLTPEEEAKFAHWLASVRGPDSKDPNFVVQPRPQGRQTKVIITEYELPRLDISGPRHRRRCPGPGLVLDPSQLLCRPAQSRQRACRGIPRSAAAAGECAPRHPLDLRRSERPSLGLGELGAQYLDARSEDERLQARGLERAGADQLADGRQL